MASQDYLIAIALIEQNDLRAMPLGGKEIKEKLDEEGNLNKITKKYGKSGLSNCNCINRAK